MEESDGKSGKSYAGRMAFGGPRSKGYVDREDGPEDERGHGLHVHWEEEDPNAVKLLRVVAYGHAPGGDFETQEAVP